MKRGGGWNVFRERDRKERRGREKERERHPWYTSTNRRLTGHKKRAEKNGHISQAPENVLVILRRVLLIDEWGVFKLLPPWSCFNGDCIWQAAECFGTSVIWRSSVQCHRTTRLVTIVIGCEDEEPCCPASHWKIFGSRLDLFQFSLSKSLVIFFFLPSLIGFFKTPNALCTLVLV